ncbi:MAG: Rid family hydrolase [Cyclobacteriaceae bacterium]
MMQTFDSDKAPEPVGSYPHAKVAGPFLYLSGVGPRTRNSDEIPGVELDEDGEIIWYDIEEQCHSVFSNVRNILEASGARWEDLIDITVFLTDMKKDFKRFNQIYAEYFRDHQPCRTTVEVNALPTPISIELKCIAYIGDRE